MCETPLTAWGATIEYTIRARCACGGVWNLVEETVDASDPRLTIILPLDTACPQCGQRFYVDASRKGERIYLIRQPTAPPPTGAG